MDAGRALGLDVHLSFHSNLVCYDGTVFLCVGIVLAVEEVVLPIGAIRRQGRRLAVVHG